jgi:hypothetical protein
MLWLDDPSDLSRIIADAGRVTTAGNGNTIAAALQVFSRQDWQVPVNRRTVLKTNHPQGGE